MKLAKTLALLSLLATPFQVAQAAGDRPPSPDMVPKIPQFDLKTTVLEFPTGLRILIQEDHSHPVATVYKYVGHGFNDDPEGAEETAHFVEHVWFRSLHGGMPPIMFVIQDLGTMFNATTAADRTDYRTTANVKYLPILLKLESLRMTDFYRGVTEEQITVEREVIRNEWRRRNEQSTALLLDYMNEVVYPADHPYAKRSTHETLNEITLPVIQKYVDDYYVPEDTTITIVGDFETQEVISMILENFDLSLLHPTLTDAFMDDEANAEVMAKIMDYRPKPGTNVPDPEVDPEGWEAFKADANNWRLFLRNPDNPDDANDVSWFLFNAKEDQLPARMGKRVEPPPVGNTEPVTRKGPVDKTTVLVGWSLPAGYRDDHFNLVVLGNMATGYVQDGLQTNFGKDVVAREASCFAQPQLHATTLLCGAEINNKRLDPANVAEKMIDQMANIQIPEDAFSQQVFSGQFGRAKQEQFRDLLNSMDLIAAVFGSRAEYIGEYAHWTGNPNYYSTAMKQVANLQAQSIVQLAHDYLRRDRAGILVVEPLAKKDIDTASADSSYGGASEGDAVIEASDDLDKANQQAIAASYAKPRLDDIVDMKMENGLRVVYLQHGNVPKVHARLILGGGTAVEPSGLHNFAARFSQSEGYDPLRFAGTPTYYFSPPYLGFGESVAKPIGGAGPTGFALGITAPSGNLDSALWTIRAELETLSPYTSGAKSWVKRQYSNLERNFFESGWHQGKMQSEHLFPGSQRYAPQSWEEIDVMSGWGAADIKTYLDDHLHPENATLLIVGNVPKDVALAHAVQQFGGWEAASGSAKATRPDLEAPAMPTAESRLVIFDDDKRTQTQTRMSCRLNAKGPEDEEAVRILGSMLSNQILANLRVKEGLAYSPGGGAFMQQDGSAVLVFSSLAVNRGVGRTVEFFRYIVEKVEKGEIDPNEIKLHQLRLNRGSGVGNQSVEQMAGMLSGAILDEASWDDLMTKGDRVAAVTAEDLSRLVEGCLDHSYTSLEGPQDVVTPQLDEKGFAYEIYDYEKAGEDLLWKYNPKAAKKREKAEKKRKKKEDEAEGEGEESSENDSSADAEE